jgi:hypothetical protein
VHKTEPSTVNIVVIAINVMRREWEEEMYKLTNV